MSSYKLTYFNVRGAAEVARIIMAYGDIEYEDNRIGNEEWEWFKSSTPFGQLPILEVDGETICQSTAIARFLAKKAGLYGSSDVEAAKIDMVIDCMEDALQPLRTIYSEKDETEKEKKRRAYQESLEGELKKLEALMEGNFFVANKLSWADISIVNSLTYPSLMGFNLPMGKVPKLMALLQNIMCHPKIAPWITRRPYTEY